MTRVYAFNGDADGLCALQQLRLAGEPAAEAAATLVTGSSVTSRCWSGSRCRRRRATRSRCWTCRWT